MKAVYWVLFVALLAGLNSCMWGVPDKKTSGVTRDTVTYSYKIIKQQASDCGNKSDSDCTIAKIKYPIFKDKPLLNILIISKITGSKDTSVNTMLTGFFKSYDDSKKDTAGMHVPYDMGDNILVVRQDSSLITLQSDISEFTGGAHGSEYISFINWNTKANKNVELNDILNSGYNESLTKTGEIIFRKNEKLSATASLANDYFFKDAKFSLPENFLLTPLGIRFLYNNYEIKPYAAGQTELLIPYTQIKSLLRPNTVISQYIK